MSHLRKTTDIAKIPVITRFELGEKRGKEHLVRSKRPNWWQVSSYMTPVARLSTFRKAAAACFEHPLIRSRDGKVAYALNTEVSFSASHVPSQFLTECIARRNGLGFSQRIFENVFSDLGNFLTPAAKNSARLIAPLDMLQLDQKQIPLGPEARVRRLSLLQIADLANHCPVLAHFYGIGVRPWFTTVSNSTAHSNGKGLTRMWRGKRSGQS